MGKVTLTAYSNSGTDAQVSANSSVNARMATSKEIIRRGVNVLPENYQRPITFEKVKCMNHVHAAQNSRTLEIRVSVSKLGEQGTYGFCRLPYQAMELPTTSGI